MFCFVVGDVGTSLALAYLPRFVGDGEGRRPLDTKAAAPAISARACSIARSGVITGLVRPRPRAVVAEQMVSFSVGVVARPPVCTAVP